MNDMERYKNQIPAFIKGALSAEDRKLMEEAISADPDLREEYLQLNRMYHGIGMIDDINEGHIDGESLAAYAEDPAQVEPVVREDIEQHIKDCAECREELNLCRAAIKEPARRIQESEPAWYRRLIDFLFPVSLPVRPVVAYSAVVLLAVTTYLAFDSDLWQTQQVARFEIVDIDQRGDGDVTLLTIDRSARVVGLNLALPTRENEKYDFSLFDPEGRLTMTWHAVPHNLPIAIEIPVTYLSPGRNTLRGIGETVQQPEGVSVDTLETVFEVQFRD